ncbi:MAG: hypothetical protein K8R21_09505 [Leptospira sp.]|nr:hypothetical protein [Leptospira sp.]
METGSPRKFNSEIVIEEDDQWWFRGSTITQQKVLDYFKDNMQEDASGIFIDNKYGKLSENGYVHCKGFPLQIRNYITEDGVTFLKSDDDKLIPLSDAVFYLDSHDRLFAMKTGQKFLKYRLSKDFLNFISKFILEENGNYFLDIGGKKMPVLQYSGSIEVKIPADYS